MGITVMPQPALDLLGKFAFAKMKADKAEKEAAKAIKEAAAAKKEAAKAIKEAAAAKKETVEAKKETVEAKKTTAQAEKTAAKLQDTLDKHKGFYAHLLSRSEFKKIQKQDNLDAKIAALEQKKHELEDSFEDATKRQEVAEKKLKNANIAVNRVDADLQATRDPSTHAELTVQKGETSKELQAALGNPDLHAVKTVTDLLELTNAELEKARNDKACDDNGGNPKQLCEEEDNTSDQSTRPAKKQCTWANRTGQAVLNGGRAAYNFVATTGQQALQSAEQKWQEVPLQGRMLATGITMYLTGHVGPVFCVAASAETRHWMQPAHSTNAPPNTEGTP